MEHTKSSDNNSFFDNVSKSYKTLKEKTFGLTTGFNRLRREDFFKKLGGRITETPFNKNNK